MTEIKGKRCDCCSEIISSRDDEIHTTFETKRVLYCRTCYAVMLEQKEIQPIPASKAKTTFSILIRVVILILILKYMSIEFQILSVFLFYVEFTVSIKKIQTAIFSIKANAIKKHHMKYGHYDVKLHEADYRTTVEKAIYYRSTDSANELENVMVKEIKPSLSAVSLAKIELNSFFTSGIFSTKIFTNILYVTLYILTFTVYIYVLSYFGIMYINSH